MRPNRLPPGHGVKNKEQNFSRPSANEAKETKGTNRYQLHAAVSCDLMNNMKRVSLQSQAFG